MNTLGDRVKKERIRLGMTQDELAKKAGYSSRTSINKIENGRPASLKVVHKLAKALNVSEWYLLGSDNGAYSERFVPDVKSEPPLSEEKTGCISFIAEDTFLKDFINYLKSNNWEVQEVHLAPEKNDKTYVKYLITNKNGASITLTKEEFKKIQDQTLEFVEGTLVDEFKNKIGL